jgi:hypothetical protein
MSSNTNKSSAIREVRYTATPKALKDYNNDGIITPADDAFVDPDDDFGFNESWQDFSDAKKYSQPRQVDY